MPRLVLAYCRGPPDTITRNGLHKVPRCARKKSCSRFYGYTFCGRSAGEPHNKLGFY